MVPSRYQEAIYNFVTSGKGSAIVSAVAGSGKTTTIVKAVSLIPKNQKILMLAFNKTIAEELNTRINLPNVEVKTFHACGLAAYKALFPKAKVDSNKLYHVMDSITAGMNLTFMEREKMQVVPKMVRLAKSMGIGSSVMANEDSNWIALAEHHDIGDDSGFDVASVLPFCKAALEKSNSMTAIIDFDDMIYMPVQQNLRFKKYDWIFVDEAQDVSNTQRWILKSLMGPKSRLIAVGDSCQPVGTIVETPSGSMNIEDIQVGDSVVSYSVAHATYLKGGKKVSGVTHRPYDGQLIVAKAETGNVSKYTSNHHCLVKLPSDNRYVVYMMRRGTDYRIGMCKMRYQSGFGPLARLRTEGGDAIWVLDSFSSKEEASLAEQVASTKFGISGVTFSPVNKETDSGMNESFLNKLWGIIGNNWDRASDCLSSFGRNIHYPLCTKGENYAARRPVVTRACNLFDGMQVRVYSGKANARVWTNISVSREDYVGTVVSLEVEDTHLYIGDGIVTHNCQAIYGFRGADSESIEGIRSDFNAITLPLSISYRCAKSIVLEAQKTVPHIEASETASEGSVITMSNYGFSDFKKSDAILCRNVAPLVKMAYGLISRGIPANMMGRDIGKGLTTLVKNLRAKDVYELTGKLQAWEAKEVTRLQKEKNKDSLLESMTDKLECIRLFMSQNTSGKIIDLIKEIEGFFTEDLNGCITLATVHRSKGLEFDRVFILDRSRFNPKWAKLEWMVNQEKNLVYVAVTRAKKDLVYISSNKWKA